MDHNSIGRFDLLAGQVGSQRLVAFTLSSKFSGSAFLFLRRDEQDIADPAFKIDLSAWPVEILPAGNHQPNNALQPTAKGGG